MFYFPFVYYKIKSDNLILSLAANNFDKNSCNVLGVENDPAAEDCETERLVVERQ